MKHLLFTALLWLPASLMAQGTVLLLKGKNKTVHRFYPGRHIVFTTTDGMPVNGEIHRLTRDSIFLYYYQVKRYANQFGGAVNDTTGRYTMPFSLANIGSFPRHRNLLLGGAVMLGGLGYTAVNLVNTIRQHDAPFGSSNLPNVAAGFGAALCGYLLNKSKRKTYTLGEKYRLEVVY